MHCQLKIQTLKSFSKKPLWVYERLVLDFALEIHLVDLDWLILDSHLPCNLRTCVLKNLTIIVNNILINYINAKQEAIIIISNLLKHSHTTNL